MDKAYSLPASPNFKDRTGQRFGRLVVLAYAGRSKAGTSLWRCRCDCGTEKVTYVCSLVSGSCRSCGCLERENRHTTTRVHGNAVDKKHTLTYRSWAMMLQRCNNPKSPYFDRYGGRGITVCDRWRSFVNFLADMGERPSKGHSIDRFPDKDGNYQPDNCRWATRKQQMNNTRRNRFLTYNGQTKTRTEWAESVGLNPATLCYRLDSGWPLDEALGFSTHRIIRS